MFQAASALVFVVDAQSDPYSAEIAHCKSVFKRAWQINPKVHLEVFIHKTDGDVFSVDEIRSECQRQIHDKLINHLHGEGVGANVVFYSTSIYDHTIFEACSRVAQRLVPQTQTLEALLDILVANCRMERAFLIDVMSRTFIATDTAPFDPSCFELCTDMVELVIEISGIYSQPTEGVGGESSQNPNPSSSSSSSSVPEMSPCTSSLIQLSSEHVLYLKEVHRLVALACVIRGENLERQPLIDYNIKVLRDAMQELFGDVARQDG
eukprot:CAMPEP_0113850844 /NCGR_PEP_ID=MMETSP0372-20130328/4186_1 /TAXON_ID=340204 /ORGANISM="Lankesteria abbotti" /LENGTH=264 /DNA_ID=CAMNT_0000821339 /DNA_START=222 /DNA_END=1016 /DNA_ORIENTATION=- /assembly_acc=CAM_ASM_000359